MITVKNLSFSYSQLPFIENMNFQVRSGEIFGSLNIRGVFLLIIMKLEISLTISMRVLVSILNFLVFMRNSPHWRT